MSPSTPLLTTVALRDKINEAFASYLSVKTQFVMPVKLSMLADIAGICVRCAFKFLRIFHRLIAKIFMRRISSLLVEIQLFSQTIAWPKQYSSFVKNTIISIMSTRASPIPLASTLSEIFARKSRSFVRPLRLRSAVLQTLQPLSLMWSPRCV